MSIAPVVSTSDISKIGKLFDVKPVKLPAEVEGKPTSASGEMKTQVLLVKAKKHAIKDCKAKVFFMGANMPMPWANLGVKTKLDEWTVGIMRDTVDLLPEEEIQLPVWHAYQGPEREATVYVNSNPVFPINFGPGRP